MTLKPIPFLEQLKKSLQGKSMNVSGMLSAVGMVHVQLELCLTLESFGIILAKYKIKQKNTVSMNLKFPEEDIHLNDILQEIYNVIPLYLLKSIIKKSILSL
ncbi:hypothetical protein LOD99_3945 [Oopsacas minuta]|uniref:Uncharacterized protein n=1 Tax=Oopsacas minuta TaxID=111878 RepID=A0AAV7JX70_9METZ|nr:hypothetical protein LOD99_3945 [Oopsacas minuta]